MLTNFVKHGNHMSIEIHYLRSHSSTFAEIIGDLNKEQRKRFHHNIKAMEKKSQRRWVIHMMLKSLEAFARKSYKRKFVDDTE